MADSSLAIQVQTVGDVLVVDSRLLAERLAIEHDNFLQTIGNYQSQIEQAFGILLFETGKIKGRGRPPRYALLTEDQATFVMTLSRNTPEVVQCKIDLVSAFTKAKQALNQIQLPQDYDEALEHLIAQRRIVKTLNAQLSEAAPKVEMYDKVMQSGQNLSIGAFAKLTGLMGQNKLFAFLREQQILIPGGPRKNTPYQRFIDDGYFSVIESLIEPVGKLVLITHVTPKGQEYVLNKLQDAGYTRMVG